MTTDVIYDIWDTQTKITRSFPVSPVNESECPFRDLHFWPQIHCIMSQTTLYNESMRPLCIFCLLCLPLSSRTNVDIWLKVYWFMLGSGAGVRGDFKCEVDGAKWEQTAVSGSVFIYLFFKIRGFSFKVSSVVETRITNDSLLTSGTCCALCVVNKGEEKVYSG